MDIFQAIFLALIQGITEFLPVSSSAHLILPAQIFGWTDQGLAFDVAVHLGTLIAVVIYFRQDILQLTGQWFSTGLTRQPSADARLAWLIILATIPAGMAGLLFNDWIEAHLRSTFVIANATIGFGLLLWYADRKYQPTMTLVNMTIVTAVIIGVAQALALIPGTSRSGITITAALLLGFSRHDAARFSFLLSIPLITAASLLKGNELLSSDVVVDWLVLLAGVSVAAVSAWFCIHYFLAIINRIGMLPFVMYRLLLGAVLFLFFV